MPRPGLFRMARRRQRASAKTVSSFSTWRETLRDIGDMLSGIYQDLRGDISDGLAKSHKSMRAKWQNPFKTQSE